MADKRADQQSKMSPEDVRRFLEHLPAGLRPSQRENRAAEEVAMSTDERISGVGSNAAKLEEQMRSLTQDLQRLTAGLETDEATQPVMTGGFAQTKGFNMGATIEADSAVEGVYITGGNLQVDGLVKGEIVCRGALVISEQGVVQGLVEAAEIILAGRLEGEVECQGSFVVLPTGWLSGKVSAAEVTIQDGAYYAGELRLQNQRAQESSPRSLALLELLERRKGAGLSLADLQGPSTVGTPGNTAGSSVGLGSSLFWPSSEASWDDTERGDGDTAPEIADDSDQAVKARGQTLESSKIGGTS